MEWINTAEQVPENGQEVLIFFVDNYYVVTYQKGYFANEFLTIKENKLTHWAALTPPKH